MFTEYLDYSLNPSLQFDIQFTDTGVSGKIRVGVYQYEGPDMKVKDLESLADRVKALYQEYATDALYKLRSVIDYIKTKKGSKIMSSTSTTSTITGASLNNLFTNANTSTNCTVSWTASTVDDAIRKHEKELANAPDDSVTNIFDPKTMTADYYEKGRKVGTRNFPKITNVEFFNDGRAVKLTFSDGTYERATLDKTDERAIEEAGVAICYLKRMLSKDPLNHPTSGSSIYHKIIDTIFKKHRDLARAKLKAEQDKAAKAARKARRQAAKAAKINAKIERDAEVLARALIKAGLSSETNLVIDRENI